MKLDLTTLKSITNGACRIEYDNGVYSFYRFTKEQEEMYKDRSEDFYRKTFSTTGMPFSSTPREMPYILA